MPDNELLPVFSSIPLPQYVAPAQRPAMGQHNDRMYAMQQAILQGQRNVMIGVRNNEIVYVPLSEAIRSDKPFDRKLIKVLDELSI